MGNLRLLLKGEPLTDAEITLLLGAQTQLAVICGLVLFLIFLVAKWKQKAEFGQPLVGPALAAAGVPVGVVKAMFLLCNIFRPEMLPRLSELPWAVGGALVCAIVLGIGSITSAFKMPEPEQKVSIEN